MTRIWQCSEQCGRCLVIIEDSESDPTPPKPFCVFPEYPGHERMVEWVEKK